MRSFVAERMRRLGSAALNVGASLPGVAMIVGTIERSRQRRVNEELQRRISTVERRIEPDDDAFIADLQKRSPWDGDGRIP